MDNESGSITAFMSKSQEQNKDLMEKFIAVAKPESVFSPPVTSGDVTVITASEVMVSMGFSHGMGMGKKMKEGATAREAPASGGGGGGGGGGISIARPAFAISISRQGVEVRPLFDMTKIAIAALTTVGTMLIVMAKILRRWR